MSGSARLIPTVCSIFVGRLPGVHGQIPGPLHQREPVFQPGAGDGALEGSTRWVR